MLCGIASTTTFVAVVFLNSDCSAAHGVGPRPGSLIGDDQVRF